MDKAKRILIQFWRKYAQRDLIAAQKISAELPDIAIYHCQQSAEKALKGFLIFHDKEPGDTHNINTLVKEASAFKPEFTTVLKEVGYLSQYNQTYRYPKESTEDFNPSAGELKHCTSARQGCLRFGFSCNAKRNSWVALVINTP